MMETTEAVVAQGTLTVTCQRDELQHALGIVSRGVSTRTTVQILSGILLEASEGKLRLAATDMEVSLRTIARCEGGVGRARSSSRAGCCSSSRGSCRSRRSRSSTSPRKRRSRSAAALRATACIRTTRRTSRACRTPRSTCTRSTARRCSRRWRASAARPRVTSRGPVLTGVLVRFETGKLVMAATDSYRLSVKETAFEGSVPELEAIVPARALTELARIAPEGESVSLGVHENQVVFGTRHCVADDAPHRRAVPELQAARPGCLRARGAGAARGAARRGSARVRDGAAQLAAAAALRRG